MSRLEQIRSLLVKQPEDVFLNFSLGMEHQSAGNADEAIRQFERTLELDAHYLAAYVQKGQVQIKLQRFDDARATLENGRTVAERIGDLHMRDNINDMLEMI